MRIFFKLPFNLFVQRMCSYSWEDTSKLVLSYMYICLTHIRSVKGGVNEVGYFLQTVTYTSTLE